MLLGVRIQNFGLFRDDCIGALLDDIRKTPDGSSLALEAGLDVAHPLNGMEALVGRNHSGKTMFFSFLSFVRESVMNGPSGAAVSGGRTGFSNLMLDEDKPIEATLLFSFINEGKKTYCEYRLIIAANRHGKPHFDTEILRIWNKDMDDVEEVLSFHQGDGFIVRNGFKTEMEMDDSQTSALRAFGAVKDYYFVNRTYHEIIRWLFVDFPRNFAQQDPEDVAPGGHKHLNINGSNAGNVLQYLKVEQPGRYKELIAKMIEVVPSLKNKDEEAVLKFFKKPDALALYMLLLFDPSPRPLIFLEAPDEGLYHDMVDTLAREMRNYTVLNPGCQIMFTTHNPYIIENLSPDEIWVFCRGDNAGEEKVDIKCAGSIPIVREMYNQGVGMGAIWYAGHFED